MASFKTAFAEARAKGQKTFPWKGKEYTTKRADDVSLPKSAPTPTARPSRSDKGSTGNADNAASSRGYGPAWNDGKGYNQNPGGKTTMGKPTKTMVPGNQALRASTEARTSTVQRNSAAANATANSAIKHFAMTPVKMPSGDRAAVIASEKRYMNDDKRTERKKRRS